MNIPRPEYPRPQFVRENWINLNGHWSCRFDSGKSGSEQGWQKSEGFEQPINVPFCPESRLSGVGHTDFIEMMWYHRTIAIPAEWAGKKLLLHFGSVDYECEIFLDGSPVARHVGGSSPFTVDLTGKAQPGKTHHLVVKVADDLRGGNQPFGKQAPWFGSRGCSYTRTTGIWQTVWMEGVDPNGLVRCRATPDFDGGSFVFTPDFFTPGRNCKLKTVIFAEGKPVAETVAACGNGIPFVLKLANPVAWSPAHPFLYEIVYEVTDENGRTVDRVESYAGLRKIHVEGDRYYLNNEPLFVRFVLDQGFYPDGIWTAPTDEALKRDIELSLGAGFNGARLHQKIFDERFHYWADKLGYLTWAEFPDWGMAFWQHFRKTPADYNRCFRDYFAEWSAVIERDVNHPSIIAWTPFNETTNWLEINEHRRIIGDVYDLTRRLDPTRPVNGTSGYVHFKTDLWTVHNYSQNATELVGKLRTSPIYCKEPEVELCAYNGQPYIVDEYGGVKYIPADRKPFAANSWGYGEAPASQAEAFQRIHDLTLALVGMEELSGYCYTQLTDVEQEENGVYCYDRTAKFDMEAIRKVFSAKPPWSRF